MPVVIQIDRSARLISSTFNGEISENDLRAAITQLSREPGFDPAFSHIIDFTHVIMARVSTEFVRSLVRQESLFDLSATQVVVAPQKYIFGLARMAEILRGHQLRTVKVVQSLAEAYESLGIDPSGKKSSRGDKQESTP